MTKKSFVCKYYYEIQLFKKKEGRYTSRNCRQEKGDMVVGEHQAFTDREPQICMYGYKKTKRKREQKKKTYISYTKKSVVMKKHVLLHILITKKKGGREKWF